MAKAKKKKEQSKQFGKRYNLLVEYDMLEVDEKIDGGSDSIDNMLDEIAEEEGKTEYVGSGINMRSLIRDRQYEISGPNKVFPLAAKIMEEAEGLDLESFRLTISVAE